MFKINKNESYSYVIDKDFNFVSISDELLSSNPELKIGDKCYKALADLDSPCRICPIMNKLSSVKYSYNNKVNKWSNLSCAKINYPEHGDCHMVICDMIDDTINDKILNLSDYNSYDKIYEVDVTSDKYRIIVDKYGLPIKRYGEYTDLIDILLEKLIHPSDRKRFKESLIDNLIDKKTTSSMNYALKDRFLINDDSGNYIRVQLISIEKDLEGKLKKFLFLFKYVKENYIDYSHLNTDKLTGLVRGNDYYSLVEQLINNNPDIEYSIVSIDIEHFKMFNEWYGFKEGDKFLIEIGSKLNEIDKTINSISGYFGDDNFCIVLPNKEQNYKLLELKLSDYIKTHGNGVSFLPHYGVYVIKDRSLNVSQMYDRAMLANDNSKGNFTERFSYYNDEMLGKLKNEQTIQQEVKKGMMNNEFTFYLQPQYNIETDKIIACEALVRWINKDGSIIPAYKFIPVLEKTGFIVEIDKFVWEEVFKWIKSLIDKGIKPIPISVNVSRIDLYYLDVASIFCGLLDKYKIEPSLIDIEITESAYIESFEKIKSTLNKLQSVGFRILMDDFGSGYSSLNMLKNVDVDILKLDMKFLELNKDNQKGVNILESIINMIKIINIPMICEGVETEEQKNLLIEIGCRYAQGYLFNRPMPKEKFEPLLNEENVDYSGIHFKKADKLHIQEFYNENLINEYDINKLLGAMALFSVSEGSLELKRVNEQFCKLFVFTSLSDVEIKSGVMKYIHPDDHKKFFETLDLAYENQPQSKSTEFRYLLRNNVVYIRMKVNYLSQNNNQKVYYATFENISDEKEKENKTLLLNKILKTTLRIGRINCFEWNILKNELKIFTPFSKLPLYGNDFEHHKSYVLVKNFPNTIVNEAIIGKYFTLVSNYISKIHNINSDEEISFEMPFTYQGGYLWYQIKGKGIFDEYNNLVAFVGTYLDITKVVYTRFEEREKVKSLNFLNENAIYSMDVNLNHDTIYNIYGEYDPNLEMVKSVKQYDIFIKGLATYFLHEDDKYKFINLFSKESLINAYKKHKLFVSMDCRTLVTGQSYWIKVSVYLRKIENDIIAYMFCNDINMYYNDQSFDIHKYVDNNNYGVININLDNHAVINANHLAAVIHNYNDINDLLPRIHNGVIDSIYIHDKNIILEKMSMLANPGDHQTFEYRIPLQNGDYKYILCNAVVQTYKNNNFIQLLTYDNTAQKKLELDLMNQEALKELKSLNASNENKAFFVGINKIYEAIYFCNINLNSFISIKNPNSLNPCISESNSYDDFIRNYIREFVIEDDKEKMTLMCSRNYVKNHLTKNNEKYVVTYRRKTNDGYKWFRLDLVASTVDPRGNLENIILLATDIHDEMKLSIAHRNEMDQYKELFINSTSEIYTDMLFINLDSFYAVKTMFKNNSVVEESFNRPWDEVYKDLLKIVGDEYIEAIKDNLSIESLLSLEFGEKRSFRYSTKSKNNSRWFTSTVNLIELKGVKHAVVFSMDITKDFNELMFARRNSEYDGLTMLYNRRKLSTLMDTEFKNLSSCGVIFFDINGLKEINDKNGHYAGDVIIKIAADSVKSVEDEHIYGFRYGGDEFLVIVKNENEEYLDDIVNRIRENINNQNITSQYHCSIAIGKAYSDRTIDVEELISIADSLMYREKENISKQEHVFDYDQKINSLLNFLSNEYQVIYEINLKEDSLKLLESNKNLILNDIPIHGTYSSFIKFYFSKYSHSNADLEVFLKDSLIKLLKEKTSIKFTPSTLSGNKLEIAYHCINYDEENKPEVVILTIKYI